MEYREMSGFSLNVNAKAKAAPYTEAAFAPNPLSGLFLVSLGHGSRYSLIGFFVSLFTIVLVEQALTQANRLGGHFNQLIIVDEFQCLLKG